MVADLSDTGVTDDFWHEKRNKVTIKQVIVVFINIEGCKKLMYKHVTRLQQKRRPSKIC